MSARIMSGDIVHYGVGPDLAWWLGGSISTLALIGGLAVLVVNARRRSARRAARVPAPAIVELLDAGSEPRRPLSLQVAQRKSCALAYRMDLSIGDPGDGFGWPPVSFDLLATSLTDDGSILMVATAATDAVEGRAHPTVADGERYRWRVDPRGREIDGAALPPGVDALPPIQLPEEPLGIGAKFRVRTTGRRAELEALCEATYELVKHDEEGLHLECEESLHFVPGRLSGLERTRGHRGGEAQVHATMVLDLASGLVIRGTASMKGNIEDDGGESMVVGQTVEVRPAR